METGPGGIKKLDTREIYHTYLELRYHSNLSLSLTFYFQIVLYLQKKV